ncbi:hypothetical protein K438DRAFT_1985196 [Mycena galopus ATCC 62051]|nr:hypothetical protein K438DRAFT_1985196 [Mycena galopus ATCC 62051]
MASVSYPSAIDTRTTPAGKIASVRILATINVCDLHARLPVPPHHPARCRRLPFSSRSTSSFARWHLTCIAGGALRHGHVNPLPFRCTTQLSNAPSAEFSAYRNHDEYEAAAGQYMDLDDHRPSLSSTRFAPPFVILAIVVLPPLSLHSSAHVTHTFPPSLTASPWCLHLDPAPSHLRATRTTLPSTYPHSALLFPSPLRSFFARMYNANTRSSQTPTRRGPCSFREDQSSTTPVLPLPPSPPSATRAAAQHEHRGAAHEGAPEAQAQHYEDDDARFVLKHPASISGHTAVEVRSGFVCLAERTFPCVGGISFCGVDAEVVCRGPALACGCADVDLSIFDPSYPLRGGPVWALCPCPSSLVQHAPCAVFLHVELADVGDLAGTLMVLREGGAVALWLARLFARHAFPLPRLFVSPPHPCALDTPRLSRRCPSLAGWTSDERVGAYTRRANWLLFHFAFHCYCLYLLVDYINTSAIPPCTTRVIVGCSWLLLVVLELFVVVGMWLCLVTIIFSTFSFIAVIFFWDVSGIRPVVLVTPSFVAALCAK